VAIFRLKFCENGENRSEKCAVKLNELVKAMNRTRKSLLYARIVLPTLCCVAQMQRERLAARAAMG